MDSRVAARGLSSCSCRLIKCSMWTVPPDIEHCIAGQILNLWGTRKVPNVIMLLLFYLLSHVRLFVTPRTVACQASLSMGFSRQEYWSKFLFSSPGDLPDPPWLQPHLLHCRQVLYHWVIIITMPYVNRKFGVNSVLSHALLSVMIRRTWCYIRPMRNLEFGEVSWASQIVQW